MATSKHICVVGAGAFGLIAIKQIKEVQGFTGTVFEQTDRIGGLWHYVENTYSDVNDLPVQSAVYGELT